MTASSQDDILVLVGPDEEIEHLSLARMSAVSPRRKDELTRGSVRGRTALAMLLSAALLIPVIVLCVFYINQLDRTARGIVNQDVELIRTGDRISLTFLRAQQHEAAFARSGDSTSLLAARLDFELVDSLCRLGAALGPELPRVRQPSAPAAWPFSYLRKRHTSRRRSAPSSRGDGRSRQHHRLCIRRTGRSQSGRPARRMGTAQHPHALLVVIVALVWLIIALPARIVLPVKRIANALNRAEQGELDVRVNAGTSDELGRLATRSTASLPACARLTSARSTASSCSNAGSSSSPPTSPKECWFFDRISNLVFANAASEPLVASRPMKRPAVRSTNSHSLSSCANHSRTRSPARRRTRSAVSCRPARFGRLSGSLRDSTGSVIAALVVSTRNFYLHVKEAKDKFEQTNNLPITTDGLMDVDVCHWLMQGSVKGSGDRPDVLTGQGVLLLGCGAPGPAELQRDGKAVKSTRGAGLYRVRVPLQLTGTPPAGPPQMGNEP